MNAQLIREKTCFGVESVHGRYPRLFIHDKVVGYTFHVQVDEQTTVKIKLSRDESDQLKAWINEIPHYSEFNGEFEQFEAAR